MDRAEADDSMRNELQGMYRERDRLVEQMQEATLERDRLSAMYRKENHAKNSHLLRVAQLKDEYAELRARYEDGVYTNPIRHVSWQPLHSSFTRCVQLWEPVLRVLTGRGATLNTIQSTKCAVTFRYRQCAR